MGNGQAFNDIRFPELSRRIQYYKNTEKGREDMCQLVEDYAKEVKEEALKETARRLLQEGISVTLVVKGTGLSQEDVLAIKEEEGL